MTRDPGGQARNKSDADGIWAQPSLRHLLQTPVGQPQVVQPDSRNKEGRESHLLRTALISASGDAENWNV